MGGTTSAPIAHIQLIRPEDLPRFRGVGAVANAQPLWARSEGQMEHLTIPFIGEERAASISLQLMGQLSGAVDDAGGGIGHRRVGLMPWWLRHDGGCADRGQGVVEPSAYIASFSASPTDPDTPSHAHPQWCVAHHPVAHPPLTTVSGL